MAIDLSPGYKPSADEEFMNPKQVASVGAWKSRAQICGESLLRVSHRKPMTAAAGRGTRPTMSVRTRSENYGSKPRAVQMLLRQAERAVAKLDNDTFWHCEDTGEPVDLKRLPAQPTTSLSLAAQQARSGRAR
jgi:DnaK suppressor protein